MVTGGEDGIWGLQEHLTAVVIDELRNANWQRANEGAAKGKQSPHPKPFPRPGGTGEGGGRSDKNSPQRQAARQRALRRAADRMQAIAAGHIQ